MKSGDLKQKNDGLMGMDGFEDNCKIGGNTQWRNED